MVHRFMFCLLGDVFSLFFFKFHQNGKTVYGDKKTETCYSLDLDLLKLIEVNAFIQT